MFFFVYIFKSLQHSSIFIAMEDNIDFMFSEKLFLEFAAPLSIVSLNLLKKNLR